MTNRKKPSGQKTAGKSKGSLLNQISKLKPVGVINGKSWTLIMREHSPQQFKEVLEVVQDYVKGGHTYKVFKAVTKLHKYLCGKDPENKCEPMISVSQDAFSRFVERVRNGQEY